MNTQDPLERRPVARQGRASSPLKRDKRGRREFVPADAQDIIGEQPWKADPDVFCCGIVTFLERTADLAQVVIEFDRPEGGFVPVTLCTSNSIGLTATAEIEKFDFVVVSGAFQELLVDDSSGVAIRLSSLNVLRKDKPPCPWLWDHNNTVLRINGRLPDPPLIQVPERRNDGPKTETGTIRIVMDNKESPSHEFGLEGPWWLNLYHIGGEFLAVPTHRGFPKAVVDSDP